MPKNPRVYLNSNQTAVKQEPVTVHPPVASPPVVQPPAPPVPVKTEGQLIWEEIKDLPIQMFGLPNQTVELHATPFEVDPHRLFLTIRSSAVLPSLESTLAEYTDKMDMVAKKVADVQHTVPINHSRFTVELADRFVIVTRTPQPLFPVKK